MMNLDFGISENLGFNGDYGLGYTISSKIAIAGDSIASGSFAYDPMNIYLSMYVGYSIKSSNFAVGGRRVYEVDANFQEVLNYRPKYVILHVGTNDLAYFSTFGAEEDHFDSILAKCQSIGATLLVSEVLPRGIYNIYDTAIANWNTALATWCSTNDVTLLESHDVMMESGNEPRPNPLYFKETSLLHPNLLGYRVMIQSWFESFIPYPSKVNPPQKFLVQHLFDGTPISGTTVYDRLGAETRDIQRGRAYLFNGSTYLTGTTLSQLSVNSNYTIAFRFHMVGYTNGMSILNHVTGTNDRLHIYVATNEIRFGHKDATSNYYTTSGAVSAGGIYDVVCIHDGTTKANSMYINGVLQTGTTAAVSDLTAGFSIGRTVNGIWPMQNNNLLYDFRIFSEKMDYRKVIDYTNMEYPSLTANTGTLVRWFKMDEQSGSSCIDACYSTGGNLTITGTPHSGVQNRISFQNDVGYCKLGSVFYPLNKLDAVPTGTWDEEHVGQCKYNATLSSSAMDGQTEWTDDSLTLTQPQAPALIQADTSNFWFETDGTPKEITYQEVITNNNYLIFADTLNNTKNILTYSYPQSGEVLSKLRDYVNLFYSDADYLIHLRMQENIEDTNILDSLQQVNATSVRDLSDMYFTDTDGAGLQFNGTSDFLSFGTDDKLNIETKFTRTSKISDFDAHQGMAFDDDYFYLADTDNIDRRIIDSPYTIQNTVTLSELNTWLENQGETLTNQPNHIGDIEVDDTYVYVPIEYFIDFNTITDVYILYLNKTTLQPVDFIKNHVSGREFTGVCLKGDEIIVCSHVSETDYYRYDRNTKEYLGVITAQKAITWKQGITYNPENDEFYVQGHHTSNRFIHCFDGDLNFISTIYPDDTPTPEGLCWRNSVLKYMSESVPTQYINTLTRPNKISTGLSIYTKFKTDSTASAQTLFSRFGTDANKRQYMLSIVDGTDLKFEIFQDGTAGANNTTLTVADVIVTDQLHEAWVVVDFSNQTVKLYLDKLEIGSAVYDRPTSGQSQSTFIGKKDSATPTYFSGKLYDIKFYDGVESINNILDIPDLSAWSDSYPIIINKSKISGTNTTARIMITEYNVPATFWSIVKSNGSDIVFTNSDGVKLKRELVRIDVGNQTMKLFVLLTGLTSASNTTITIHYGNSSASETNDVEVWDGYLGVWHLDQNTVDSTGNNSNGTLLGAPVAITTGKLGGGYSFNGTTDKINLGSNAILDNLSPVSVMAWWYKIANTVNVNHHIVSKGNATTLQRVFIQNLSSPAEDLRIWVAANSGTSEVRTVDGVVTTGNWYYTMTRWDRSTSGNRVIYNNGSSLTIDYNTTAGVSDLSDADGDVIVSGRKQDDGRCLYGHIEEVRIYGGNYSTDSYITEYNSMNEPTSFYIME